MDAVRLAGDGHNRGMGSAGGAWLEAGLEVFLGWACAGCARPGARLCSGCRAALDGVPYPVLRGGCQGPIFAGSRFTGSTRQLVTALKERDAWHLARPLGEQLGAAAAASLAELRGPTAPAGVVLVPVPSSKRAVRTRGLDVTAVLAGRAATRLSRAGVRCRVLGALRQRPGVLDQSGLSALGRRANMTDGFLATRGGTRELWRSTANGGTAVLLVDDIVTTGSTLASAAHALFQQGVGVDGFAVIAEKP